MKTLEVKFNSLGEQVKRTVLFNKDGSLKRSNKNQALDIDENNAIKGWWEIFFEGQEGIKYEAQFRYDNNKGVRTFEPISVITLKGNELVSMDCTEVKCNIC